MRNDLHRPSDIPGLDEVIGALRDLGGSSTAVKLCDALVAAGYQRGRAQLAIQRATDDAIAIGHDWTLSIKQGQT